MPFHLTSDQELIRKTVRELLEDVKGATAEDIDHARRFPKAEIAKLAGMGLTAMLVPAEKGGAGTDTVSFVLALEEAARASGVLALTLCQANAMGTYPIALHATDETRDAVLPGLVAGEHFAAWALAEPNAGVDVGGVETRARKDGDAYVVSGVKSFVVGAPHAAWFIVFARTAKDAGLTALLVPRDAEGVKVAPAERAMTHRGADMAQVFLRDVRVPASHRLGEEGQASRLVEECQRLAALGGAAIAIGLMNAAREDSIAYSGDREQFRTPLKKFQAIQWLVADMDVHVRAARLLAYAAADRRDRGEPFGDDVAAAKLYAGEAAKWVTQKGIRIHGGTGFMRDLPVERYNRDARAMSLYAGTSEMQRMTLAARALDL